MRRKRAFASGLALAILIGATSSNRAHAEESATEGASEGAPQADPARARAEELFLKGMELYDQEKYAEALQQFRRSHGEVPSPNSRLMAARCLRGLGRMPEAFAEYDAALVEAETAAAGDQKYADTVAAVKEELPEVRAKVAIVMVEIDGNAPLDTRLLVGGRVIERSAWKRPIPAAPGTISIILEGKGIEREEEVLDLNGGEKDDVELEVETLPTGATAESPAEQARKAQLRTGAYVAGGVAGVGLVAFGIVALADGSDGLKYASLGLGAAGLVTGVVLYALSMPGSGGSKAGASAALVVGPASMGVVGSF